MGGSHELERQLSLLVIGKQLNKPARKKVGVKKRKACTRHSRGDERMQAAPVGRVGTIEVDRVFGVVKVRELGGLRVGMDGPQVWMVRSHTHYSTLLLFCPIISVTFSHPVRYR